MKFINTSKEQSVTIEAFGIFNLKPGEICEIAEGYARPSRASNGGRKPSIVEGLAPQLKPADADERAHWLRTPTKQEIAARADEERIPSVEQLMKKGYAKGVAEAEVKKLVAARDAARK